MPAARPIIVSTTLTIVLALACADPADPAFSPDAGIARIDLGGEADARLDNLPYGIGTLRRRAPGTPCAAGNPRQFDFWVGDWAVVGPNGGVGATNRIVTDLDGCVVMENWRPQGGFAGRSLNAWDADAAVWRQTWVPTRGRPFRMEGGLRPDGVMDLTGTRVHATLGARYVDHYWWTRLSDEQVRQSFTFDIDQFNIHQSGAILYTRRTPLPAMTTQVDTRCQAGGDTGESRALDASTGTWQVRADPGPQLGSSVVTVDVDGCLLEERFETPKGYRAISWTYYDPIVQRWHRAIADNEGEYHALVGTRDGAVLTLEGHEPLPGHPDARVRVVQRTAADGVQQEWSTSADGGASWRHVRTIAFWRAAP